MKLFSSFGAGLLSILFSLAPLAVTADTQPPAEVQAAVRYLIEYVSESDRTFIRNAHEYRSADAAEHMQRKYEHFRDRIHTVDDFIELAASRSLASGKPYLVVGQSGSTIPTADWLREVLATHCSLATKSDGSTPKCPD
jgi:hypothetical protein